ncbi:hypothetical protein SU48_00015 [Deinococcus puniceus]|uniref:Uncharacterized protein n=1 Tax=Deinococcus puniceus TaxID=1182568 RepID=A0A172T5U6_9DEIO|nr:hypothetical protein SU48_00015 [Deinococcus puniceus]
MGQSVANSSPCAVLSTSPPASRRSSMALSNTAREARSSVPNGSSSSVIGRARPNAAAKATFCRVPRDSTLGQAFSQGVRPNSAAKSSNGSVGTCHAAAIKRRYSCTCKSSGKYTSVGTYMQAWRACTDPGTPPPTVPSPLMGNSPTKARRNVVLPAPFAPCK